MVWVEVCVCVCVCVCVQKKTSQEIVRRRIFNSSFLYTLTLNS